MVQRLLNSLADEMAAGNTVELRNFGVFDVVTRKNVLDEIPNVRKKLLPYQSEPASGSDPAACHNSFVPQLVSRIPVTIAKRKAPRACDCSSDYWTQPLPIFVNF